MSRRRAAVAAALIALLAAACGGRNPATGGSAAYQKAVAYAQCMRSHGEPGLPDPSSAGTFSLGQVNINSTEYQTAGQACQNLLPNSAQFQLSSAQKETMLRAALRHAECMRAHGIADFPDPAPDGIVVHGAAIAITFGADAPGDLRAELKSPRGQAAAKACSRYSPFAKHGAPAQVKP